MPIKELQMGNYWNSRVICDMETIRIKIQEFTAGMMKSVDIPSETSRVLVLGTEEFMFPAMKFGRCLEQAYADFEVKFHATTRSPIEVSLDEKYPLHNRVSLDSMYETGRAIFLYNLDAYDKVIIITDAQPINQNGLKDLAGALELFGNTDITMVQWSKLENEE